MTAGIPVGAFPYNVIPDVDYAVWQSDCFKIRAESKSLLVLRLPSDWADKCTVIPDFITIFLIDFS